MANFSIGDIFVSVSNGQVQWRDSTGAIKAPNLNNNSGGFTTGMAFDTAGNLYVTNFDNNKIDVYDTTGTLLGTFGSGYNADPESIVFDALGNAYVGQANGTGDVLKFDAAGTFLASFDVAIERRGSDWIDLAADQKTLFYTSEGATIKRYDVSTNTQLPDFATGLPGANAYALRIIPQDGGVLVADSDRVRRFDAAGNFVQDYFPTGNGGGVFALNLDPDGTSFWTADFSSANVWKIDIATGAELLSFNTGTGTDTVFGLAIFGEQTAAVCNTCEPLCHDRVIPFTCEISSFPFTISEIGNPNFNGNLLDNVLCTTGTCLQTVVFTLCDAPLTCCITVGTVNFSGTADLLLTIPATFETDCEPESVDLWCAAPITINQTCFTCFGQEQCPDDICGLLDLLSITAHTIDAHTVQITGTVEFKCPNL
jgi:streptogramin lyase